jgi:dolichol-phosphate mannosyltransferase
VAAAELAAEAPGAPVTLPASGPELSVPQLSVPQESVLHPSVPQLPVPRLSVVIPARDEGERISGVLDRLFASVRRSAEVLVVVDSAADSTVAAVHGYARPAPASGAGVAGPGGDVAGPGSTAAEGRLYCLVNEYGAGPASAIRFGLDRATAPVIVVVMADGCDDAAQIDQLALLVEQGAVVAAASRYARGGSQRGGPLLKRTLSRLAGLSLRALAGAGTSDATNSFKAYSADFVGAVGVQSRRGFSVGLELTAKARRLRLPVAEIPTSWQERRSGRSGFRLVRWLPGYLRWYLYCFGRPRRPGRAGGAAGG